MVPIGRAIKTRVAARKMHFWSFPDPPPDHLPGEVFPFRHWRLDHRALGHLDSASRLFLPSIVAQVGRSPSLAHPPFSGGFRPVTRRAPGRGHWLLGPSCHLGLLASSLPAIDHAGSAEMVSTFLLFVFRER